MSAPSDDAIQVDAGAVIRNIEHISMRLMHDLAVSQARLEASETDNAELRRQLRVKEALGNNSADASE